MYRILIVDDNVVNLDFLKVSLEDTYNLSLAKNGEIALKIVEKLNPDLVLLDINMPVMDGYTVYNKIREKDRFKETPIFFLSGNDEIDYDMIHNTSEEIILFSKPFDIGQIKEKIENILMNK